MSAALPVVVDIFDVDDARTAALRFGDFFDSSWKNASKYFLARKIFALTFFNAPFPASFSLFQSFLESN